RTTTNDRLILSLQLPSSLVNPAQLLALTEITSWSFQPRLVTRLRRHREEIAFLLFSPQPISCHGAALRQSWRSPFAELTQGIPVFGGSYCSWEFLPQHLLPFF